MMCVGLNTSPAVQAHEQKTLAVILLDDGIPSGNITDPTFVQGNAVWFRMEDSTNNTSMVVQLDLDQDGVFNASNDFESGALVNACELDENGTLVDESCAVSATYAFPANASTGTYTFWIHRTHNESEERWEYHIVVHEDVHVEEGDGPSPGDCLVWVVPMKRRLLATLSMKKRPMKQRWCCSSPSSLWWAWWRPFSPSKRNGAKKRPFRASTKKSDSPFDQRATKVVDDFDHVR